MEVHTDANKQKNPHTNAFKHTPTFKGDILNLMTMLIRKITLVKIRKCWNGFKKEDQSLKDKLMSNNIFKMLKYITDKMKTWEEKHNTLSFTCM